MNIKTLIITLLLLVVSLSMHAQITKPDVMPEPDYDPYYFLSIYLDYPDEALAEGAEGEVFVRFIIDTNGVLKDVHAIDTVGINQHLVIEAVETVKKFPPWQPGVLNGKPVAVYYTIPVNFKLGFKWYEIGKVKRQARRRARLKKEYKETYGY